jgi:SpoU rRNA methylase family enzyme
VTWQEIRRAHPDQWVIIEFEKLDDALEVLEGRVIAAAPTREEIYRRVMTDGRGRDVAIRYCGDLPPDFAVMFWLPNSR